MRLRGKGANALRQFAWRLRRYKGKIRYVCIDMSQAYSAWVAENLPKAKVVFIPQRIAPLPIEIFWARTISAHAVKLSGS